MPAEDDVQSNSSASLTDASENFDFLSAMLPILKQSEETQEKGPAALDITRKSASVAVPRAAGQLTTNANADLQ